MRNRVSHWAASQPAALTMPFQESRPKLKYLKNPSIVRLAMSETTSATFWARVRWGVAIRTQRTTTGSSSQLLQCRCGRACPRLSSNGTGCFHAAGRNCPAWASPAT